MSPTCPICFNEEDKNSSFITFPCHCTACVDCISQWITLKISEKQYTIDSRTTCIMADCKKDMSLQEIYQRIPLSSQQKMDEALLQVYFSRQQDIRKCPDSNCQYAGIINLKKSCTSPLQCSLCGIQWRDKQHYTKFEKILNYLKNRSKAKAEDLSQAWIKQRSKKCPSCKVNIEKNGGCDHMTCKHCNYEFCWICFRRHPAHYQLIHSYHQHFIPFMAILLILSVLIYILYSFGIMLTLKFFVNGLTWLLSSSCILIAKLIYHSISLSMWLVFHSIALFGWLIGCIIPYLVESISFCLTLAVQLIYNSVNLLVWLIKGMVTCISWLINCSIPNLVEFISWSCTFIVQLICHLAHLLVWLFYQSIVYFGWLIDCSTPVLVEFLSCSLTFFIWLISSSITFLAWIIHCSKAFFGWLIDCSVPFLIEFISCSLSVLIKLISLSIAFLGWMIHGLTTLFTSSIFYLMQFFSQEGSSSLQTSEEFL